MFEALERVARAGDRVQLNSGQSERWHVATRVDIVTHMKTTIDIADALLREAKRVAERENTTVRALVEDGLRRALAERKERRRAFKFKLVTFKGSGLARGVDPELPRSLAYERDE